MSGLPSEGNLTLSYLCSLRASVFLYRCTCFQNSAYRVTDDNSKPLELSYYLCQAADVTTVHKHMVGRFWSKPTARPNLEAMMKPIWSTWALYKKDINETYVREFADRCVNSI